MAWLAVPGPADLPAHESLSHYLEHRGSVIVDARNIDVQLDLTFYYPRSRAGRERMDRDRNGLVSDDEIRDFLSFVGREVEEKVHLKVRGKEVPLMPLLTPRLEVGDRRIDAKDPFTLHLSAFARMPAWLEEGDEIALHDGLWADEPGIHSCRVEGSGGIEAFALPGESSLQPAGRARVSRLRVAALPAAFAREPVSDAAPRDAVAAGPAPGARTRVWLVILGGMALVAAAVIVIGPRFRTKGSRKNNFTFCGRIFNRSSC